MNISRSPDNIPHPPTAVRRSPVHSWKGRLRREVESARRVVVLGVGNPDRADDAAGLACAGALRQTVGRRYRTRLNVLLGYEAPENLTGKVRRFRPDLVLILDAAAGTGRPGAIFFVEPGQIADEAVTTHNLSQRMLVGYLENSIGARAVVLGIQPKTLAAGNELSAPVRRAVTTIVNFLGSLWLVSARK